MCFVKYVIAKVPGLLASEISNLISQDISVLPDNMCATCLKLTAIKMLICWFHLLVLRMVCEIDISIM